MRHVSRRTHRDLRAVPQESDAGDERLQRVAEGPLLYAAMVGLRQA